MAHSVRGLARVRGWDVDGIHHCPLYVPHRTCVVSVFTETVRVVVRGKRWRVREEGKLVGLDGLWWLSFGVNAILDAHFWASGLT